MKSDGYLIEIIFWIMIFFEKLKFFTSPILSVVVAIIE